MRPRERRHTNGGPGVMPDVVLFCSHCASPTNKADMIKETNPDSPVYGMLTCKRPGCFEGPGNPGYLDYGSKDFTDNVGLTPGAIPGITWKR